MGVNLNVSFIGYGKIAQALIKGLLPYQHYHIQAAAPSLKTDIHESRIKTTSDNLAVLKNADVIILAIKPTIMATILTEIQSFIPDHCLLISVATGLNLNWYAAHIPANTALVRAMPNIAASVGKSATPLLANEHVTDHHRYLTMKLFNDIGISTWIQRESDMDTFTALSGSGPAYVFQFIQSMIDAASNFGLEENIATSFALETFFGAVTLAMENKQSLKQLTDQVTSKGGTTAAALAIFHEKHLAEIIAAAMNAARNRAKELNLSIL